MELVCIKAGHSSNISGVTAEGTEGLHTEVTNGLSNTEGALPKCSMRNLPEGG